MDNRRYNNNFNLLRMIAASAVLISHAYPISLGTGAAEPLTAFLRITLGSLAVLTFFAISGYFISGSYDKKSSSIAFWVARILRIYPALLIVLLITDIVIGPVFTTEHLGDYFRNPETASYVPRNLTLHWLQYDLPDVFRDNPYPDAINGSLWTLRYEVACYAMVAAVAALGLTVRSRRFIVFLSLYFVLYMVLKLTHLQRGPSIDILQSLTFPFVIGMVFYQFSRHIRFSGVVCVIGALGSILAYGSQWFHEIFVLFWCYFIFYLGYQQWKLLGLYNRLGDYSYGMYIYAFPCEQMSVELWKGISPVGLILISFPMTLLCAVLSWHLLEKRALARRSAVAGWLERNLFHLSSALGYRPTWKRR